MSYRKFYMTYISYYAITSAVLLEKTCCGLTLVDSYALVLFLSPIRIGEG